MREVMETDVCTVDPSRSVLDVYRSLPEGSPERRQRLYPVIEANAGLVGVLPRSAVLDAKDRPEVTVRDVMVSSISVSYPDEILRRVADRMAALKLGALPVVDRSEATRLDGLITQFDLVAARQKLLEEERHAERVLTLRRVTMRPNGSEQPVQDASHD